MKQKYSPKDFQLSKKYVDAVYTMDRLYRSQPGLLGKTILNEGFVNVDLNNLNEAYVDLESWPVAKSQLLSLYREYAALENEVRKNYMAEQILSLIALGEWAFEGKYISYRKLVSDLLYMDSSPVTAEQVSADQNYMYNLLSDKGYKGSFAEKLTSWRQDNTVDRNSLKEVIEEIIHILKERSLDLGFYEIESSCMDCVVETNVPYQACCDVANNALRVNGDLEFTYQDLKHLMAHELFPGHLAQMERRRRLVREEIVPADSGLVITNTASSAIFEGIADNGLRFAGLLENIDDEINRVYQNLKGKAALTAGYMMHEENRNDEEIRQYFRNTLLATEAWIDSRISLVRCAFRKPFIYTYYRGNGVVSEVYDRVSKESNIRFLDYLYNNMHSIDSLRMFV